MNTLMYGAGLSPPIVKETKPFELPPKNDNMRRVYAYLITRRGIDRDVLNTFVHQKMIYESADYHNAVFVGYDMDGVPRHAHKRGTGSTSTYKGNADSSMPEYSFHWVGTDNELYLFEAPIMNAGLVLTSLASHTGESLEIYFDKISENL